jgi:hypothetical protein
MKRFLLALLCCLAVAAVGCTDSSPSSPSACGVCPGPFFKTVYEGCAGTYIGGGLGGTFSLCEVLYSQPDLDAFWTSLWSDPVPQVDFSQVWVIAIYQRFCTACCGGSWEVQSVEETPDCISIEIQQNCNPAECDGNANCACAVLVTIPQADKPVCVFGWEPVPCPWF